MLSNERRGLEPALRAARQFGAESVANNLAPWSASDRADIAHYYGVDEWSDIPETDRDKLLAEYRRGGELERSLR